MCSLAEQISALSDPRPQSIDPEDLFQEDSAALLCDFPDEASDPVRVQGAVSSLRARLRNAQLEDDARYGGRTVSRRQLEDEWGDEEGSLVTIVHRLLYTVVVIHNGIVTSSLSRDLCLGLPRSGDRWCGLNWVC